MATSVALSAGRQRYRGGVDIDERQILGTRSRQEDRSLAFWCHGALLLAISDGMGGHPRGDEASAICIETLKAAFERANPKKLDDWSAALHAAVACADDAVAALGASLEADAKRPGATLVALLLVPRLEIWAYASVGDSYLYWMLKSGRFSRMNALHENQEGKLTSYVGGGMRLVDGVDTTMLLHPGDTFLLATDGLDVLTEEEIRVSLSDRRVRASTAAASLLERVEAKRDSEQDNATVLVARVPSLDRRSRHPAGFLDVSR